jgi:hypothetical protein
VRIWDVAAGYLNRQSLLGEHRELHGVYVIITQGKTGYARHPETLRWRSCLTGLTRRHQQLAAEMRLRGYVDRSPLPPPPARVRWPAAFIDEPAEQLARLRHKYQAKEANQTKETNQGKEAKDGGRIALPTGPHELWAQHKYSVMARSPETYRAIGRRVARLRRGSPITDLARELVALLREIPARPRLLNALEHMWGHVRAAASQEDRARARLGAAELLERTQALAMRAREPYLLASTALSELAIFVEPS